MGKAIVEELVKAGYNVTAFSRANSSATFPPGVAVRKVDYDSVESLKEALEGQDAVVSAIATVAVGGQNPLIDAAMQAGVKRFIPSEFGLNTRIVEGTAIGKILQGKIKTVDYLDEKSKANPGFTWTGVSSGLFFDWVRATASIAMSTLTDMFRTGTHVRLDRRRQNYENRNHLRLWERAGAGVQPEFHRPGGRRHPS